MHGQRRINPCLRRARAAQRCVVLPSGVLPRPASAHTQYDNCFAEAADVRERYEAMRDALNKTGRAM
jgi:hypothetical protein